MMTPKELAILAAKALDEKKGKEISAIEITDITTLADYFVIATGSSNTQINALCGSVEKLLEEVSFSAGCSSATQTVVVDAAYVDVRLDMLAQREDLARYVL